jgi:hypothetical protein
MIIKIYPIFLDMKRNIKKLLESEKEEINRRKNV